MKPSIPRCLDPVCGGLVKPAIVFFGEKITSSFHDLVMKDFPTSDLLIVVGTSLKVQRFRCDGLKKEMYFFDVAILRK